MDINKAILTGRLTRDPTIKNTQGGAAICEFGVAINREWLDRATNAKKEETVFVDIVAFGGTATAVGNNLTKGAAVAVEGRLQLDSWDDKTTGQKRSKLRIVAETVKFLDRKGGGSTDAASAPQTGGNQFRRQPQPAAQSRPNDYDAPPSMDNDMPPGTEADVPF